MDFDVATSDRVESPQLEARIARVLEAIEHPEALVTDESMMWDFAPFGAQPAEGKSWLDEVRTKLGLDELSMRDYIWQVAERLPK